jgi:hypothetical protein
MKRVIASVLAVSALMVAVNASAYVQQTTVTTTRQYGGAHHDDWRHRQWVREQQHRQWVESHRHYHHGY